MTGTKLLPFFMLFNICVANDFEGTSFHSEDLDSTRFVQLEQLIESNYFRQIRGVVVLKGGKILYENYFNRADQETLQDIRSAGKSITSVLMGIAFDKGFLADVDQPLLSFFPEYDRTTNWDPRKDSITLRNTLSMSIGLDVSDGNYEEGSYGNVESYGPDWITDILSKPMIFDPGSMIDYSSGAVSLCGPVIRRVSGMSVPVFADSFLFGPLGITNYQWTEFPDGHVCTSGSFWMRTIDFAKIGQLYLQKGRWQGELLVSEEWVEESTQDRFSTAPWIKIGYGYYWWTEKYYFDDRLIECFFAQGNGGNRVHVFPSDDVVIAITSSAYSQGYMFDQVRMMINTFILPAAILPKGSYDSHASIVTVPTTGILLTTALLLSALLLWPIAAFRNRKSSAQSPSTPQRPFPRPAVVAIWFCALIHLAFILLIFAESSFELFLNTGYDYEIPAFHLTVNWLLTISAGLAAVFGLTSIARKWGTTRRRLHFVAVSLVCVYMLFVIYSWDALILLG
jgi:CubicO group peptidase (beta-lactamase class C family)